MLMVARWSTRLERFQRLPEFVCLSGVEWFEIHTSVQWRTQEMNARDVLRVFVARKGLPLVAVDCVGHNAIPGGRDVCWSVVYCCTSRVGEL